MLCSVCKTNAAVIFINRSNDASQMEGLCYECAKKEREDNYEKYDAYAYINNTFQCFDNMDRKHPEFYGCLENNKNGEKYECNKCIYYMRPNYYSNTFINGIL